MLNTQVWPVATLLNSDVLDHIFLFIIPSICLLYIIYNLFDIKDKVYTYFSFFLMFLDIYMCISVYNLYLPFQMFYWLLL